MNVRSEGDPSEMSSLLCAYSNSKPTMTRPVPTAKPLVGAIRGSWVDAEKRGDVGGRSGRDSEKADDEKKRHNPAVRGEHPQG